MHLAEFLPPVTIMAAYMAAYGARVATLRRQRRPVAGWRIAAFAAGATIVALAQIPALDDLADRVLVAHMTQHLLIGDIAAFLLVLGLTGPVLQPLLRLRAGGWTRTLMNPVVALTLWALDMYVWRVPFLYQAAIRHDLLHALEHASYLWFGMLLWVALLGPLPKPAWFTNWARLGYVVAVRLLGAALANAFIWSQTLFYPVYRATDAHAGLNPLSDQNVAGAVMMVEQVLLTVGLLAWLFLRFAQQDEERQQLLDLARARGVPLADERAARAVAAGAAGRLRERVTQASPGMATRTPSDRCSGPEPSGLGGAERP
jgi:cytochrome c oxidase assembly factor CtaG